MNKIYNDKYLEGVEGKKTGKKTKKGFTTLKSSATQPTTIPKKIEFNTKTIMYYEWAKNRGYERSLGDFLNEICEAYFRAKGVQPVIYIVPRSEQIAQY